MTMDKSTARRYQLTGGNRHNWASVSAQISPEMQRKLMAHCGKHKITRSQLIRSLIHEELENGHG